MTAEVVSLRCAWCRGQFLMLVSSAERPRCPGCGVSLPLYATGAAIATGDGFMPVGATWNTRTWGGLREFEVLA